MKFIRTTFFSAIITFMRLASGFISNKVIALYTGPAGVALVGAFTNFTLIVFTLANGAINTGVVKYTAEYGAEENKLKVLFSTAFKISVYCSAITGILLLTLGSWISEYLFADHLFLKPIRILGVTVILYALNALLISILNGKSSLKAYTIVNSAATAIGLIFTIVLVYFYKVEGALYSLVLSQSVVFFISAALVIKSNWFTADYFKQKFDKLTAVKLTHYSLMAIVTAVSAPFTQIIIRNMALKNFGIDAAGYWQGMTRISDGYLMLITTSLATYYLPRLSSIKIKKELRKEIYQTYKVILPAVFAGSILIYMLRFLIIKIMYTSAFLNMEQLFLWQLTGDFFKVATWLLSYLMLARAMTKLYIITEVFFSLTYIVFAHIFLKEFGLQGITIAFAVNNFIYFLTMVLSFRKLLFDRRKYPVNQFRK